MKVTASPLKDILIIEPKIYGDSRGFFFESYNQDKYAQNGIKTKFVQDNFSRSSKGVLRGLHYQLHKPQAKLVSINKGEVYDVAVDIRLGSPTFGKWFGILLSEENRIQLYIPEGFAHGFYVLSDTVDFMYKCSEFYSPESEKGILWNDPDIDIQWPLNGNSPELSVKDNNLWFLNDMPKEFLPKYKEKF